jgi:hypothetical protein
MKMKLSTILLLTAALASAQQTKQGNKPAAKAAESKEAKQAPAKQLKVPEGAEQIEPYTFRHRDAQGKVWIYRETPFGIVRYEESKQAPVAPVASDNDMMAFDSGDSIRFELKGLLGKSTWTRKKTEQLTEAEKKAWERAKGGKEQTK